MITFAHYSPTTVHVLRNGTRIGSFYRESASSWSLFTRIDLDFSEVFAIQEAFYSSHGKHATPELVAKLNP